MSRKPKKYHFIYKTTCRITGKFYVGMHSSDSMDDGYLGSGKILGYSRKKYGDENHVREVLEHCSSRDELKQREKEIVNEELLANPLNINLKYGGEGGGKFYSAQHQLKCSRAGGRVGGKIAGKIYGRANMIKANASMALTRASYVTKGMRGRKHSEVTKLKMSQSGIANSSQRGTRWINNGLKVIKIQESCLTEYLNQGFVLGRKIK